VTRAALLAGSVALAACAGGDASRARFDAEVIPVLERRCAAAACHGVAPGAEARGEHVDWDRLHVRIDDAGRIVDRDAAYAAARRFIVTDEDPALSTLLRKPLAVEQDGLPHYGGATFTGDDDPAYRALLGWIALEDEGGEDAAPLTPLEQQFADTVQPVLQAATCMTARCHGPAAGATPLHLDDGYRGRFSRAATRHNYQESLAVISLDGHPAQSRLVRKIQPLGPGIAHKALAFDFLEGEAGGLGALTAWICAEREARAGAPCAAPGDAPITGFVFVRGPVTAAGAFELDAFTPGSDLWLAHVADASLAPAALDNLTAALHPGGPADVREPAVSRDGRHVVFAMRTAADEGHHLWTIDLETRAARQLTRGNGPLPGGGLATDRDPTWGPDGAVWFTSTRAGVVADGGHVLDAELYSLDPATGELRRWTYTPHVERRPVFLDVGGEAGGEVAFTALRDVAPGRARAHSFRFPPSQRTEYHQHFGITPTATYFDDLRELPDGRYVTVVGELPAPGSLGGLAVIDRNLGPEVNERAASQVPALEQYVPPMVPLSGDGGYRDPAPLPDGRILVAHQPAGLAPGAPLTPRLELIELTERADGGGPDVAAVTVILDEPGVALTDPEPVSVRGPLRAEPALATGGAPVATLRHQGVPMIDALLRDLAPAGVKRPRADLVAIRLVEHVPLTPAQRRPIPAAETLFGVTGATTTALGGHGPARVLAELPLAADGSFHCELPAGVAFRLQALDASGLAVGAAQDRWFYGLPGQVIAQGVSAATGTARYGALCAACHGDPDGVGGRAPEMEAPDALTGASLTLARFEDQDPRRPRAPAEVGAATRREVDFRRDVQPLLDRRCGACHAGDAPAAGLDLSGAPTTHFTRSYEHLLRPGDGSGGGRAYVDDDDGRADRSFLIERLTGIERAAPRALPAPGVPHPADLSAGALTEDEVRVLARWIDLGATFVGAAPAEAP
jgi:hypothetical protein